MHKLISWYNNNRKMIWIAVITTISIMAICYYLINRITEQVDSGENVRNDNNNVTSNLNSVVMPTQDSVVTGQQSRTTESKITVIDKFVEYCNNGQIEEAYNLISDGCKNELL